MSIPYRTRRVLKRIGTVLGVLVLVTVVFWLCWVIWLQRYVVYSDEGVSLDFEQSSYGLTGQVAVPPQAEENISIFFNEGADAINTGNEMEQLNGYYITSEMFQKDMATVLTNIERLPAGTAVMIDMKGPFGSFFYESNLNDSLTSASTDIAAVAKLVERLKTKGFYTIARISAFRDRTFGENHVTSGLYMLSRAGLWMDEDGMYWLDPTNSSTTNWISSVALELKDLGFNEVMLADFRFPTSDKYIFEGDKDAALQTAATKLMEACAAEDFVLTFCVDSPSFQLPEGRCRMCLLDVDPNSVESKANMTELEEKEIRLVFLSDSADTRYDAYGILRSIMVSEEVEARKGN
ncbi:MAG: putative glycoside hydrolase [Eubacteriales bacterium]|nr:putative glycoside hydrolase [Eubacteriales bacterium]